VRLFDEISESLLKEKNFDRAVNKVIKSLGNFLMFIDSDDIPCPLGILEIMQVIQDHSCIDFVYGNVVVTDEVLVPLASMQPVGSPFSSAPVDIAGYHWHTMGAIYRRELVHRVGPWNTSLTGSQDWEYQARIKLDGARGRFIDTTIGYWRQHSGTRVGTGSFRLDYVCSVMEACASIYSRANTFYQCDSFLEIRLAKKLLLHALELGENGHLDVRKRCLRQAASTLQHQPLLRLLLFSFLILPPCIDTRLRSFLLRLN
jgi:hypothetical protein